MTYSWTVPTRRSYRWLSSQWRRRRVSPTLQGRHGHCRLLSVVSSPAFQLDAPHETDHTASSLTNRLLSAVFIRRPAVLTIYHHTTVGRPPLSADIRGLALIHWVQSHGDRQFAEKWRSATRKKPTILIKKLNIIYLILYLTLLSKLLNDTWSSELSFASCSISLFYRSITNFLMIIIIMIINCQNVVSPLLSVTGCGKRCSDKSHSRTGTHRKEGLGLALWLEFRVKDS